MKVPGIWAAGLICLVVVVGIGAMVMTFLAPSKPARTAPAGMGVGPMPAVSMGGPSDSPRDAPASPAGKEGAGGASAKDQLVSLVTKLSLLTGDSPGVTLSDDQKKVVGHQISGLDTANELSEEDARQRLDMLLEALASHREALVAAGYRWPGEGGPRSPSDASDVSNPFTEESNAKALTSLQERLVTEPSKE